jgi:hypothetical protein
LVEQGRLHYPHPTWPTDYLVRILEEASLQAARHDADWDEFWVYSVMREVKVSFQALFAAYTQQLDQVPF